MGKGTGTNYQKLFYKDYEKLFEQNSKLSCELRTIRYEYQLLLEENLQQQKEIGRLKSILNRDGTNSGTPTSQTPINKQKTIPNSREKSEKKKGGQAGHKKCKLNRFLDSEVNETIEHTVDECPACKHAGLDKTGIIEKDGLDYRIIVEKKRHTFVVYRCPCCGKEVHGEIPNNLKEENQYGPQVQSPALTLMNVGNVSINKTRKIITGFTGNEINLSEGYLAKLQKRAAGGTEKFCSELRGELLNQKLLFWDDTVIMVNKARACLRYYGTEQLALYKAHLHKDKAGLDEDNILNLLPKETTVVHDHNKVNYNDDYSFSNAECNEHLIRDLKKVIDNPGSSWAAQLKQLLSVTNIEREKKKSGGCNEFDESFTAGFFQKFNKIMLLAYSENRNSAGKYYGHEELTLITRVLDYKNEYLAWVLDFDIPFTNNLSERSLRDVKSKMKISGQFQNGKTAKYYANIKSYIETCNRNAVNGFYALHRLCTGKPLPLNEVFQRPKMGCE
ncbi:hypothetical protein FACS1894190_17310 [Spirochaetia bacterium]|nr:hypothetical protein FACS1894190_17310 [Spirochaetia bacterium]